MFAPPQMNVPPGYIFVPAQPQVAQQVVPQPAVLPQPQPQPDDATNVYVNRLAPECTREDLAAHVATHGVRHPVVEVRVLTHAQTGLSRGQGFVKYATRQGALEAVAQLDGSTLLGRELEVRLAFDNHRGSCAEQPPGGRVFLRGLPSEAVHNQLVELVGRFGKVRGCMLHSDSSRSDVPPKRFAYVSLETAEEATRAAAALHGSRPWPFCTEPLSVRVAPRRVKDKSPPGPLPTALPAYAPPHPFVLYAQPPQAQHPAPLAPMPQMHCAPGLSLPAPMPVSLPFPQQLPMQAAFYVPAPRC